jgi:hypothetical protein
MTSEAIYEKDSEIITSNDITEFMLYSKLVENPKLIGKKTLFIPDPVDIYRYPQTGSTCKCRTHKYHPLSTFNAFKSGKGP